MRFRPCIDLHRGVVKQLVGSTLRDGDEQSLVTNFEATHPAAHYAALYRRDGLTGGHVIMLGPGNEEAAASAVATYPGGLQIGGGIRPDNALRWLREGAAKVIVTSYVFAQGAVHWERLAEMARTVGCERLVLDLSCRRIGAGYRVMTDRWQRTTDVLVAADGLGRLARYCSEFLVHAVDMEGLQQGVDEQLVALLARHSPLPTTYAGGVHSSADVRTVQQLGDGRVDVTVGSALDIFGGSGLRYRDLVALDRAERQSQGPAHAANAGA